MAFSKYVKARCSYLAIELKNETSLVKENLLKRFKKEYQGNEKHIVLIDNKISWV